MAIVKTYNPIWYMDDTAENIAAMLKAEKVLPHEVIGMHATATGTIVYIKKGAQAL